MTQMINATETDLLAQIAALQAQLAAAQAAPQTAKSRAPRKARKLKLVALGDYATVRVTFADGVVIHSNASHAFETGEVDTARAVAFAEAVRRSEIAGWRNAVDVSSNWKWVQTEKGWRCRPVATIPAVESVYVLTNAEQDALRDPVRIERAADALVSAYAAIKVKLSLDEVYAECARVGMDGVTQWSRHTVRQISKHATEQIESRDIKSGRSTRTVWTYDSVEYDRHDMAVAAKCSYIRQNADVPTMINAKVSVVEAVEENETVESSQTMETSCEPAITTEEELAIVDGPAELAKLPPRIEMLVRNAVEALQGVAERIANIRAKLGARYVAEVWERMSAEMKGPSEVVAKFRRCAPSNGVDAERVLDHLGGVPTIERTEEERNYFRPVAITIPADVLASAERAGLNPAEIGGAFSRLSGRYLDRLHQAAARAAERGERSARRADIMGEARGLIVSHHVSDVGDDLDYESACSRAAEVHSVAEPVRLASRQARHTYAVHRGDYVVKLCGREEAARYAARHGGDILQLPHGWRNLETAPQLITNAQACREGRKQRLNAATFAAARDTWRATA